MAEIRNTKALGLLVRKERKVQNLTQEQLAGVTGVGIRFVRELEAGKESCHLGLAIQVMTALGLIVSIDSRNETAP
jgi:y4mF family transcriptional regulator